LDKKLAGEKTPGKRVLGVSAGWYVKTLGNKSPPGRHIELHLSVAVIITA
jgi:hypothetical protein